MKITTIYLDENKIELFNSILGKETIKVNGEIISEKRSMLGTDHNFDILENGNIVSCKLTTGFTMNGVAYSLYKNNKPIIEIPKNKLGVIILICLGALIGYGIILGFLKST